MLYVTDEPKSDVLHIHNSLGDLGKHLVTPSHGLNVICQSIWCTYTGSIMFLVQKVDDWWKEGDRRFYKKPTTRTPEVCYQFQIFQIQNKTNLYYSHRVYPACDFPNYSEQRKAHLTFHNSVLISMLQQQNKIRLLHSQCEWCTSSCHTAGFWLYVIACMSVD